MMQVRLLAGLLSVQLVLALWLNLGGSELTAFEANEPLLGVEFADIDRIEISHQDEKLELSKTKDGWSLESELKGFPVSPSRIRSFSEKLTAVKRSWPVGSTKIAAKQFKTVADEFERKITLLKGGKQLRTLYLGSSPGFRKVHARIEGEDEVYAVEFNAFDAPYKASNWYDRDVLHVKQDELEAVEIAGLRFKADDGVLMLDGLAEGEELDTEAVAALEKKLLKPSYTDVLGTENKPEYKQAEPLLRYAVHKQDGQVDITVSGPYEENYYVLKSSEHPFYFKVLKAGIDELKDLQRSKLLKATKAAAAPAAGDEAADSTTDAAAAEKAGPEAGSDLIDAAAPEANLDSVGAAPAEASEPRPEAAAAQPEPAVDNSSEEN